MIASVRPRSAITFPNSNRLTIPLKIVSFLSIKSLYCLSRSASLTLKLITCFAVCAAILPKSKDGIREQFYLGAVRRSDRNIL